MSPSGSSDIVTLKDLHPRADKENVIHYCSVSSQKEDDPGSKSNQIKRILMGAQLQSRNNSKKFLENAPKNEPNSSTINPATMFGPNPHNNKKPTFAYNISNAQHKNMRTSSQTSINSEKTQQQLQRNKNNNNNQEKIIENVASNDYNLLVKLKEYIEELKANE